MIIPGLVSVVIESDSVDDTIACVERLQQLDWHPSLLEIIVAADAAIDPDADRLATLSGQVRLVRPDAGLGVVGLRNLAAAEARGEFLAFLHADARPDGRWISSAAVTFDGGPDIGLVVGGVIDPAALYDHLALSRTVERDVLFGDTTAPFVRASVFEQLGGFAPELSPAIAHLDLAWRSTLRGNRVRYQPESYVAAGPRGGIQDAGSAESGSAVLLGRNTADGRIAGLFAESALLGFADAEVTAVLPGIAAALRDVPPPPPRRVLIVTGDPVGPRMAGPGIRAWNMAKALARDCEVRLVSTKQAVSQDASFTVASVPVAHPKAMEAHEQWAEVIVVQGHALEQFPALADSSKFLVVDIYDPMHLEQLEQAKGLPLRRWEAQIATSNQTLNHQLLLGDFFLCASERQRFFWLGQLAALGRVNARTYANDNTLASLLDVVPFGIPDEPPTATRPAIRGVVPGIGPDDKVVIWAGGIYNWFDPETLVEAIGELAKTHPDVRLFFMGVKHPNPGVPEMEAVSRARSLAARLGLADVNVFFNETWVDYADRANYLLEADLGVSTHFEHIETTFSFRTRILDYLWAGLPIVSTRGDSFAELIEERGLGAAVPERDVEALAGAIEGLLYHPEAAEAARARVAAVRSDFEWGRVLAPLIEFTRHPGHAADSRFLQGARRASVSANPAVVATRKGHGWRARFRSDFQRVTYYFNNGGVSAVLDRYRARRKLQRNTPSD